MYVPKLIIIENTHWLTCELCFCIPEFHSQYLPRIENRKSKKKKMHERYRVGRQFSCENEGISKSLDYKEWSKVFIGWKVNGNVDEAVKLDEHYKGGYLTGNSFFIFFLLHDSHKTRKFPNKYFSCSTSHLLFNLGIISCNAMLAIVHSMTTYHFHHFLHPHFHLHLRAPYHANQV